MPGEPQGGTASVGPPSVSPVPAKWAWGKIAAVVLIVLVIIAALAILLRPQNRVPVVSRTTVSAATAKVADTLTFAVQATDPDSDAITYTWDFGDGTTGAGEQISHAYTLAGHFIALVTVTDGKGGEATNDGNLLFVRIDPDVSAPADCGSENCEPGPVVAVLTADRNVASPGTPIGFDGNSSWAYAFSWKNSTNHTEGGTYSKVTAADNASLFAYFRYVWGDGTDNTTDGSESVGHTLHTFSAAGNYFVRLTVTSVPANLPPSTRSGSAGFTVRIAAGGLVQAAIAGLFAEGVVGLQTAGGNLPVPRTRTGVPLS